MIEAENTFTMLSMLEKAKEKADKLNPHIAFMDGIFEVQSNTNPEKQYKVFIGKKPTGMIYIACTCRAGLEGKACYHASAAFTRYQANIAQRLEAIEKEKRDSLHESFDQQNKSAYLKDTMQSQTEKLPNGKTRF